MSHEELCAKVTRYIEAEQKMSFELTEMVYLYALGASINAEEFKQAYEEYIDARNDIPEDVLKRLDNRKDKSNCK